MAMDHSRATYMVLLDPDSLGSWMSSVFGIVYLGAMGVFF
jgi:hypothetical protein